MLVLEQTVSDNEKLLPITQMQEENQIFKFFLGANAVILISKTIYGFWNVLLVFTRWISECKLMFQVLSLFSSERSNWVQSIKTCVLMLVVWASHSIFIFLLIFLLISITDIYCATIFFCWNSHSEYDIWKRLAKTGSDCAFLCFFNKKNSFPVEFYVEFEGLNYCATDKTIRVFLFMQQFLFFVFREQWMSL